MAAASGVVTAVFPATAPLSNNALLSNLIVDQGTLTFLPSQITYSVDVPNATSSLNISLTKADLNQTLAVTGAVYTTVTGNVYTYNASNLMVGQNLITIQVTAQNQTQNTYNITVNRPSNNADLNGLTLSGITLTPAFGSGTTSYSASVVNSISSTSVTASIYDSNSRMTVNGTAVTSGQVSGFINLNVGNNSITIVVTAQDGTAKTYTVAISRASSGGSGGTGGSTPSTDTTTSTTGTDTTTPTASTDTKAPTAPDNPFQTNVINEQDVAKAIKDAMAAAKNMKVSFSDISNHWDSKDIILAVQLHIIDGYQDGSFHPDAPVTRAEFAAMIVRAFGLEKGKTSVSFNDTASNWALNYINTLASNGIVNGYADGSFKPDATISRAEMVTVFGRILNLSQLTNDTPASFKDVSNDYWAKDAVGKASAANLVQGETTSTFEPNRGATRAEALTVIIRALESDSSIKQLIQGN